MSVAAVAIFGEKAGNRFRRMVGTDHNSFGHSGDAVLGLHSLTGFFISANEVAQFDACFAQLPVRWPAPQLYY